MERAEEEKSLFLPQLFLGALSYRMATEELLESKGAFSPLTLYVTGIIHQIAESTFFLP